MGIFNSRIDKHNATEIGFTKRIDELTDLRGQVAGIRASQAVIQFNTDGTIVEANEHFLKATGYSLAEIQGKHHSIFVDPDYRDSDPIKSFGSVWLLVNVNLVNSSASLKTTDKSGFRLTTRRFSTSTAVQ